MVRRPRCRLATGTRAASGLRPEVLWPPARSWLTIDGHTCAIDESAARRRKEDAAAERLENAIKKVIAEGTHVTYDMKPDRNDPTAVGTAEMADAIIAAL